MTRVRDSLVVMGGVETMVDGGRGYEMMVVGSGSLAEWDSSAKGFGLCGMEGRGTRCTKVGV